MHKLHTIFDVLICLIQLLALKKEATTLQKYKKIVLLSKIVQLKKKEIKNQINIHGKYKDNFSVLLKK